MAKTFFTCKRTVILILVMQGMYILLIEISIWLAALPGGDGGDDAGDGGDGRGEKQIKRHGKDVLYMLTNSYSNSGDAGCVHSVNRDQYLAGGTPGWGRR